MSTVNINLQAKDLTASGGQGVVDPTPDTLVQRTSTGAIKATEATTDNEAINKKQFDEGLAGKVDLLESSGTEAYGHNGAEQTKFPLSYNPARFSILYRDGNGRSKIADPIDNKDVANKEYVDTAIATAAVLVSPNGTKYKISVNDDGTLTTTVTT